MNEETRAQLDWLVLNRLPFLNSSMGRKLLLKNGSSATAVLATADNRLRAWGVDDGVRDRLRDWRQLGENSDLGQQGLQDLQWLQMNNAALVPWGHRCYPPLLREIGSSPPVLMVRGDPELLVRSQLAIVGGRRSTSGGREFCRRLAMELTRAGLLITSGLAKGIDAEGHKGALMAGGGTIAVLGTGLDIVYPRSHEELAEEVAARGALVSEFPLGSRPSRYSFPQRNRIISGMSLGVAVIEAALGSGSLITAQHALNQNREVFAVPGDIHNPLNRGCNKLLREGAKLIEHAAHVLEEIECQFLPRRTAVRQTGDPDGQDSGIAASQLAKLNQPQRQLLGVIGSDPIPADVAIDRSGLSPGDVAAALTELQMVGLIEQTGYGFISKVVGKTASGTTGDTGR